MPETEPQLLLGWLVSYIIMLVRGGGDGVDFKYKYECGVRGTKHYIK